MKKLLSICVSCSFLAAFCLARIPLYICAKKGSTHFFSSCCQEKASHSCCSERKHSSKQPAVEEICCSKVDLNIDSQILSFGNEKRNSDVDEHLCEMSYQGPLHGGISSSRNSERRPPPDPVGSRPQAPLYTLYCSYLC